MEGFLAVVSSQRVLGSSFVMLQTKRITEGRSPCTLAQFRLLLAGLQTCKDPVDKYLAGCAVALVQTRLRFKDAQRTVKEPSLDVLSERFRLPRVRAWRR